MRHCSNCGERITAEQQFCRSCGAELIVAAKRRGLDPRTIIFIGLFGAVAGGAVVLLGGLLGTNAIALIGFVLAVLSFVVMAVGGILAEHPRRSQTSKGGPSSIPNAGPMLEKAETTNRLSAAPAANHFPASVTEETTTKLRR